MPNSGIRLLPRVFDGKRAVHGPAPVTRYRGSESVACAVVPRFPWSRPFAPPTPQPVARPCSQASSLVWPSLTSPARTSSATAPRLPDAGRRPILAPTVRLEISRFPRKERAHMPGSTTAPDRLRTCDGVREHVAFRRGDDVSIRDQFSIAAQLLAYAYPVNASRRTSRCTAHDSGTT